MPGDASLERMLFDDYRYYRNCTAHTQRQKRERPYLRELKVTPPRLKLLAEMVEWCRDRGIEPRQWLYSLFVSRKWLFAPKLERGHLCSEKHLSKFQKITDYTIFRRRQINQQNLESLSTNSFDPNRDISQASENAKRRYLLHNDVQSCMSRISDETYGYHPRSVTCARCPAQVECRDRLQAMVDFDIQALRRGEITSEMARNRVLARAQRYDGC